VKYFLLSTACAFTVLIAYSWWLMGVPKNIDQTLWFSSLHLAALLLWAAWDELRKE